MADITSLLWHDSTDRKRKRNEEDDDASLNSSGHDPLSAARHNRQQEQLPGTIQTLPDSVLHRIFSSILIQNDPLHIARNEVILNSRQQADTILSLLTISYRFRSLATPIFLNGNSFIIDVKSFNAQASMKWLKSAQKHFFARGAIALTGAQEWTEYQSPAFAYRTLQQPTVLEHPRYLAPDEFVHRAMERLDPSLAFPINKRWDVKFNVAYEPHWENLFDWLRLWHAGELPAYGGKYMRADTKDTSLQKIEAAFDTIRGFVGKCPWSLTATALLGVRRFLILDDVRWGFAPPTGAPPAHDAKRVKQHHMVSQMVYDPSILSASNEGGRVQGGPYDDVDMEDA